MKTKIKIFYWIPRILCILAILFISLFALDAFEAGISFWKQILGFLIHLIPSFILTAILVVAWKWELVGGIIFTIIGVLFTPMIYIMNYQSNDSVSMSIGIGLAIPVPFILVGVLFIISHVLRKKQEDPNHDRTRS
ncbi:MAG: hypothetical protein ISS19_04120 [Bacteroidales bacterium]|nr:hypothetical protein [Bacteroidales bacterium]